MLRPLIPSLHHDAGCCCVMQWMLPANVTHTRQIKLTMAYTSSMRRHDVVDERRSGVKRSGMPWLACIQHHLPRLDTDHPALAIVRLHDRQGMISVHTPTGHAHTQQQLVACAPYGDNLHGDKQLAQDCGGSVTVVAS
jgi:hypothetical protein